MELLTIITSIIGVNVSIVTNTYLIRFCSFVGLLELPKEGSNAIIFHLINV